KVCPKRPHWGASPRSDPFALGAGPPGGPAGSEAASVDQDGAGGGALGFGHLEGPAVGPGPFLPVEDLGLPAVTGQPGGGVVGPVPTPEGDDGVGVAQQSGPTQGPGPLREVAVGAGAAEAPGGGAARRDGQAVTGAREG